MIFILLPLAVLTAGVFLALFIWAVRTGQFDDLETPPVRILNDDADRPLPTGDVETRETIVVSTRDC